jgi:hypothetical protein
VEVRTLLCQIFTSGATYVKLLYEYMLRINDLYDLNKIIRDAVESVLAMCSFGSGKDSSTAQVHKEKNVTH